jgi:hypothetical protein
MRSALPPVSAVRLHAPPIVTGTVALFTTTYTAVQPRDPLHEYGRPKDGGKGRDTECAHPNYICHGTDKDLAVSDFARVCGHRNAPTDGVYL